MNMDKAVDELDSEYAKGELSNKQYDEEMRDIRAQARDPYYGKSDAECFEYDQQQGWGW